MKKWEKEFDKQFLILWRKIGGKDNKITCEVEVKAFISNLLEKKKTHLKQLQHRCLKQDNYINQMEQIIKSQCASELEEALNKVISPFWERFHHYFDDVMKNVHSKLDTLIEEWRK